MRPRGLFGLRALVCGLAVICSAGLGWGQEYSHVRIVRLSFVEGSATLQRPDVAEWAQASVNTPIQEGFKIATGDNGFAEVEFENSSTARLGQLSLLEFKELLLAPNGGKVNRLTLHQGYATFHVFPEREDIYEVTTAYATVVPSGKTLFRLDLDAGILRVEVFRGTLEVSSPYGSGTLAKNTVLEVRPNGEDPFLVSQGITKDEWDEWVEQREDQLVQVRSRQAPSVYPSAYDSMFGFADLLYYGGWSFSPGYGYGWFPRVSYGWMPYTSGRWCWYPSFGYTWISFEPWGWLPYHYGLWSYLPGAGWGWFPDQFGQWNPAPVNWYQGPGWIGWGPRMRPLPGGTPGNCPAGQGCATVVPIDTFQNGQPVRPDRILPVDPARQGRPIPNPDVRPTRLGLLPGSPVERIPDWVQGRTGFEGGRPVGPRQLPGGASAGAASQPAAGGQPASGAQAGSAAPNRRLGPPETGITYDPVDRRYVNEPSSRPQTGPLSAPPTARTPQEAPAPATPAAPEPAPAVGSRQLPIRPAPQGNYPAMPPSGPPSDWRDLGNRHGPPSGVFSRPGSPGVAPGERPQAAPPAAPREAPAPAARPSSPPPTPRSAPSSGGGPVWRSAPSPGPSGGGHSTGGGPSGGFGGGRPSGGPSGGFGGGGPSGGSRGSGPSPGGGSGSGGRPPR